MASMDIYDIHSATPSLRDRLVFLLRGGMVKRFHNAATLQEQSVAAHSCNVAWFCYLLSINGPSVNLLMAAITHDMAEQFTGDNPAPAKRAMDLRETYHRKEQEVLGAYGCDFERHLTHEEHRILKLADVFDGMLFCVRERMFGNQFVECTFMKFLSYAKEFTRTTVDYDILHDLERMMEDASGN